MKTIASRIRQLLIRRRTQGERLSTVYLGHSEWSAFKREMDNFRLTETCPHSADDVVTFEGVKVIRVLVGSHFGPEWEITR